MNSVRSKYYSLKYYTVVSDNINTSNQREALLIESTSLTYMFKCINAVEGVEELDLNKNLKSKVVFIVLIKSPTTVDVFHDISCTLYILSSCMVYMLFTTLQCFRS